MPSALKTPILGGKYWEDKVYSKFNLTSCIINRPVYKHFRRAQFSSPKLMEKTVNQLSLNKTCTWLFNLEPPSKDPKLTISYLLQVGIKSAQTNLGFSSSWVINLQLLTHRNRPRTTTTGVVKTRSLFLLQRVSASSSTATWVAISWARTNSLTLQQWNEFPPQETLSLWNLG